VCSSDLSLKYVDELPSNETDIERKVIYIHKASSTYFIRGFKDNKVKKGVFSGINLDDASAILVETANAGYTPKEKSSWVLAAELMVSIFKLVTTFFNILATLYDFMRRSMSEVSSLFVGGIIALVVGIFSMIAFASSFFKMPPKEKEGSLDMSAREESPTRPLSPSDFLLAPSGYAKRNPVLSFRDDARVSISITQSMQSASDDTYSDSETLASSDDAYSDDDTSGEEFVEHPVMKGYGSRGNSPSVNSLMSSSKCHGLPVSINNQSSMFYQRDMSERSHLIPSRQIKVIVESRTEPKSLSMWETFKGCLGMETTPKIKQNQSVIAARIL
jgi:hypothetical protein